MKHVLFVYNPVAGTGIVRRRMFDIVEFYNNNDCLVTLCPGRKIEELGDELFGNDYYDYIVVSGGDGTLNNFLAYISNHDFDKAVSYVPAGSTNDYAATLGIPSDFDKALETTIHGTPRTIDIGSFNDSNFLYVAAFGIFTSVVYTTPQEIKNVMGHSAYILQGIKQITELTSYELKMTVDEEVYEGSFILGLVTNSLQVGGMKKLLPADMSLDDGLFEVMFIRTPDNLIEFNGIVMSLATETPQDNPNIIIAKAKHVSVEHKTTTEWTLDGEYAGAQDKVDISVIGKKFRIVS